MPELTFSIDGRTITANPGQSILGAALAAGIYIPHLCHHPALSAQGGCKVCTVEVRRPGGGVELLTSCTTPAEEGLVVRTTAEDAVHLRRVALELMLACHPADCTSCAVYLHCELQALLQYLGVAHSRLRRIEKENRRLASGLPNPLIKREMERCVLCGRCVRACEELRDVGILAYLEKDGETYVGVKEEKSLQISGCRFCGACVEVCPTGAIQDMPGIFPDGVPREKALVPCRYNCPAEVDIPQYLRLAGQERYAEAAAVLREKLTFPKALGFVCAKKCEAKCKRGHLNEAVAIRELKHFVLSDAKDDTRWLERVTRLPPSGKTVAVVGAGPAGLTVAWYLARKGHGVTVFEKQPLAGGMMSYGIPLYRLPREVVAEEIKVIESLGVSICTGQGVESAVQLKKDYDAVLVAVGAELGAPPPLKDLTGLENVWAAVDFCRLASTNNLPVVDSATKLVVLGGGNVAFDCGRTAKKAGAGEVTLICLESRDTMLADKEEIEAALAEGIHILSGAASKTALVKDNKVQGVEYEKVTRFQFGPKGLELETESGSAALAEATMLVYATGQQVGLDAGFGLSLGRGNRVTVDENFHSNVEGIFAAGDAVTGTKSIVEAIAAGRASASAIDKYLGGDGIVEETYWDREETPDRIGIMESFSEIPRHECLGDGETAQREAGRCLQCDLRLKIPQVKFWGDPSYRKNRKGGV